MARFAFFQRLLSREELDSVGAMYLRFVVADINEDSSRELGVFHAAEKLKDEEKLHAHEEEHYSSIVHWFADHLEKPTRFTASKPPFYRRKVRRSRGSRIPRMNTFPGFANWLSSRSITVFQFEC